MNGLQKNIQKQSGVSQSLYMYNITSMNNSINHNNEGKKHDSYQMLIKFCLNLTPDLIFSGRRGPKLPQGANLSPPAPRQTLWPLRYPINFLV